MSTAAVKLALKGLAYGADKIPDKFFETIPGGYYKSSDQAAQKVKQQAQRSKSHRRSDRESRSRRHHDYDDYDRDDYYSDHDRAPRRRSDRRRWSSVDGRDNRGQLEGRRETNYSRGLDRSERALSRGYDERDNAYGSYNQPVQDVNYPYKAYHPADYANQPGPTGPQYEDGYGTNNPDNYYRQSTAEARYTPPLQEHYRYENAGNGATEVYQQTRYQPHAHESYAPPQAEYAQVTRYVPHADAGAYYANVERPRQLYRRESRSQPVSRSGSLTRDRGRRRRSQEDSRSSRSPQRRSKSTRGVKDRLQHPDDNERKLAATLGGAAGAGMLVNGLTHNSFGTLLSATIGGFAAREIEKKASEKRAASHKRDSKVHNDRGYDSYDDDSDYERSEHPDGRRRSRRDSF